jgi:2-oxoglutarate ferredoxin oxidoreductase subunit alpha
MRALMRLDLPPEQMVRVRSVRHYDGLPIDARTITDAILEQEGKTGARG